MHISFWCSVIYQQLFILYSQLSTVLSTALQQHFPESLGARIIAEPGRYFVATAFTSVANVIAKRSVMKSVEKSAVAKANETAVAARECDGNDKIRALVHEYYINDGVFNSFADIVFQGTMFPMRLLKQVIW